MVGGKKTDGAKYRTTKLSFPLIKKEVADHKARC